MNTDLNLETTLRRLAARDGTDQPSAHEWARIRARREAGDRVDLPIAGEPRRTGRVRRWPWIAAIAAALVAVLTPLARLRHGTPRPHSTLAPGMLVAQSSPAPAFPILERLDGPRLKPGRWIYAAEPLTAGPADTVFVYQLEPGTYQGSEVWLVLSGMRVKGAPTEFTDSTWVSRERLDLLAHWTDTVATWKPVVGYALALMQSVTLDSSWRASFPLLGNRQDVKGAALRWMNLAVYGRETVVTPAGRFRCWKVGFRPSLGFFFWITQDGLPVRQGMERPDDFAFGRMNLALLRYEPL